MKRGRYVIPFSQLRMTDVDSVGGKNASLGEMLSQLTEHGIRVPDGFATTADGFRAFLDANSLTQRISQRLATLDVEDVKALVAAGAEIRNWVANGTFPAELEREIREFHAWLSAGTSDLPVAVRSSATAEDLPDASFAGQQETYLNVVGIEAVLDRIRHVFASLYNDRAISYRVHKGFTHGEVALSAGIQRMVRSDRGAAGVMFTMDTESGFRDVVFITSSYGLGETVVQGAVNPDEFYVHTPMLKAGRFALIRRSLGSKLIKMEFDPAATSGRTVRTVDVADADRRRFSIADDEVLELARYAMEIERHYGRPMDIEWGRDGVDGKIYVLQARPETVKSRDVHGQTQRYRLKSRSTVLASGRAIGQRVGAGPVRIIHDASEMDRVQPGDVLVTDMTDPNWEPVMKRAAAIVTNRGGRTCHAAIIARELGIPAVVGCGDATGHLVDGAIVTVSCAEGDTGNVYDGNLDVEVETAAATRMPDLPVKIMMNLGNPELAFEMQGLPNAGVGLARLEFIINNHIGVHPRAVLEYPNIDADLARAVESLARGYGTPRDFYQIRLAEGIATIAAAFWPKPVVVRMSDFKTNEYASLLGGADFEPHEENPMIGFRGASRYAHPAYVEGFALECVAMKRVREEMGLTNVILIDQFAELFDGFSIGSNDLTQLTLGVDRDSEIVAFDYDERDEGVKEMIRLAVEGCRRNGIHSGFCGQAPSDYPDMAEYLVGLGIDSISLNPDTLVKTTRQVLDLERRTPGRQVA